jgi:HD-GYP domain-containing protein (c-di-GMP phosphodiesterase class II)
MATSRHTPRTPSETFDVVQTHRDRPETLKLPRFSSDIASVRELAVNPPRPAGRRELARRAEALRRYRADERVQNIAAAGELAYLRSQLRAAARLTARLAATREVEEMARLVVDELHETFAFYLAAVQRLDDDGLLRLIAGRGQLAEVMTEFLLVEQSVREGVNGRVARSGVTALVADTREDPDYISRDPHTDPRSELSVAIVVDGAVWGVLNIEAVEADALSEADAVLVEAIAASFGSALHRAELIADIERSFTTTLAVVTSTVEAKDDYTACHGSDVAELAERVALRMGLSMKEARGVHYAAMLHDVGKIAVPSEILCKEGPLTEDEWVVMRTHTVVGAELVQRIDAFAHLAPAIRSSHERIDGKGYPDGLAGERIPLAARIVAACDTYDAIVTDRPYRAGRSSTQAREELLRASGSQLDERVVAVLLEELAAEPAGEPAGVSPR